MTLTTSRACVRAAIHEYMPSEVTIGQNTHNRVKNSYFLGFATPRGNLSPKYVLCRDGRPSRVYKSEFKRGIAPRQG